MVRPRSTGEVALCIAMLLGLLLVTQILAGGDGSLTTIVHRVVRHPVAVLEHLVGGVVVLGLVAVGAAAIFTRPRRLLG